MVYGALFGCFWADNGQRKEALQVVSVGWKPVDVFVVHRRISGVALMPEVQRQSLKQDCVVSGPDQRCVRMMSLPALGSSYGFRSTDCRAVHAPTYRMVPDTTFATWVWLVRCRSCRANPDKGKHPSNQSCSEVFLPVFACFCLFLPVL